jgi:TPR repeat protein
MRRLDTILLVWIMTLWLPLTAVARTSAEIEAAYHRQQSAITRLTGSSERQDKLELAKQLLSGLQVSQSNPLRRDASLRARQILEEILGQRQGDLIEAEAAELLAKGIKAENPARARMLFQLALANGSPRSNAIERELLASEALSPERDLRLSQLEAAALRESNFELLLIRMAAAQPTERATMEAQLLRLAQSKAALGEASPLGQLGLVQLIGASTDKQREDAAALILRATQMGEDRFVLKAVDALPIGSASLRPVAARLLIAAAENGLMNAAERLVTDAYGADRYAFVPATASAWLERLIEARSPVGFRLAERLSRDPPGRVKPPLGMHTAIRLALAAKDLEPQEALAYALILSEGKIANRQPKAATDFFGRALKTRDWVFMRAIAKAIEAHKDIAVLPDLLQQELLAAIVEGRSEAAMLLGELIGQGRVLRFDMDRALDAYRAAERLGAGPVAIFAQSTLLLKRAEAALDIENGLLLLDDAVAAGHNPARVALASLLRSGTLVEQNWPRAVSILRAAAYSGDAKSALTLTELAIENPLLGLSRDEIVSFLDQAIKAGIDGALEDFAAFRAGEGAKAEARNVLENALASGDLLAGAVLADDLRKGRFGPADPARTTSLLHTLRNRAMYDPAQRLGVAARLLASNDDAFQLLARDLAESHAASGAPRAMSIVSQYWRRNGTDADAARQAMEWAERAANAGSVHDQIWLGQALQSGKDLASAKAATLDPKRGFALIEQAYAFDPSDPEALMAMGASHWQGAGVPSNAAKAAEFYAIGALRGYRPAQRALARALAEGSRIARDVEKAEDVFLHSAHHGSAPARVQLGRLYLSGFGNRLDPEAAYAQFRQAAEEGSVDGMRETARALMVGSGTIKDEAAAERWFREAAKAGNADAMIDLFSLLTLKTGSVSERKAAFADAIGFLTAAADAGHAAAQFRLGLMYINGAGVEKDIAKGKALFGMAHKNGNMRGKKLLKKMERGEDINVGWSPEDGENDEDEADTP